MFYNCKLIKTWFQPVIFAPLIKSNMRDLIILRKIITQDRWKIITCITTANGKNELRKYDFHLSQLNLCNALARHVLLLFFQRREDNWDERNILQIFLRPLSNWFITNAFSDKQSSSLLRATRNCGIRQ